MPFVNSNAVTFGLANGLCTAFLKMNYANVLLHFLTEKPAKLIITVRITDRNVISKGM